MPEFHLNRCGGGAGRTIAGVSLNKFNAHDRSGRQNTGYAGLYRVSVPRQSVNLQFMRPYEYPRFPALRTMADAVRPHSGVSEYRVSGFHTSMEQIHVAEESHHKFGTG